MFLSIIIPVYNADRYIKNCVDSLVGLSAYLNIADSELEVILVDDGSKDDSGHICEELSRNQYPFVIKVLHQQNKGVSVARNEGLKNATGEWVWFIDADDSISFINENQSPLILDEKLMVITSFKWIENSCVLHHQAKITDIPYNLWRCWFKRNIIEKNSLSFTQGRKYAEDQEFIWNYLLASKCVDNERDKVFALTDVLYVYTVRMGSAMTKSGVKYKKFLDVLKVNILFIWHSVCNGNIMCSWTWKELKRMIKTMIIMILR